MSEGKWSNYGKILSDNNSHHLLRAYFVPGTLLNGLHAAGCFILKTKL